MAALDLIKKEKIPCLIFKNIAETTQYDNTGLTVLPLTILNSLYIKNNAESACKFHKYLHKLISDFKYCLCCYILVYQQGLALNNISAHLKIACGKCIIFMQSDLTLQKYIARLQYHKWLWETLGMAQKVPKPL